MTWYEYIVSRDIYQLATFLAGLAMTGELEKLKRDYEANADKLFCGAENYRALMAEDIEAWLDETISFKDGEQ